MIATKGGVYRVTCLATGKIYIGSSANIPSRWWHHRRGLRLGRHENRYLQAAWNKHGDGSFRWEVVEKVADTDDLLGREQWWIDSTGCTDGKVGYNLCPHAYTTRGLKRARPSNPPRDWIVTTPRGREMRINNLRRFCRDRGLDNGIMGMVAKGGVGSYKGWKCRPATMAAREWEELRLSRMGDRSAALSRDWIVTDPSGAESVVRNLKVFCRERGLNNSLLCMVAQGKREHHKGWKCRPVPPVRA